MNYDFNHAFSPAEFEDFARDMLQMREDRKFESFAEGKDKGIDSRSVSEDGYTVILQAKRLKSRGKYYEDCALRKRKNGQPCSCGREG